MLYGTLMFYIINIIPNKNVSLDNCVETSIQHELTGLDFGYLIRNILENKSGEN